MKIKTHCSVCNRRAKTTPIKHGHNLCMKHFKMLIVRSVGSGKPAATSSEVRS